MSSSAGLTKGVTALLWFWNKLETASFIYFYSEIRAHNGLEFLHRELETASVYSSRNK